MLAQAVTPGNCLVLLVGCVAVGSAGCSVWTGKDCPIYGNFRVTLGLCFATVLIGLIDRTYDKYERSWSSRFEQFKIFLRSPLQTGFGFAIRVGDLFCVFGDILARTSTQQSVAPEEHHDYSRRYARLPEMDTLSSSSSSSLPQHALGIRYDPDGFLEREAEAKYFIDQITNKHPVRICLLGGEGSDKSSLAQSVVQHARIVETFGSGRVLVRLQGARSSKDVLEALARCLGVPRKEMEGGWEEGVYSELERANFLVVMDGLEGVPREEVASVLRRVGGMSTVSLLVTVRGSQKPEGVRWLA